MGVSYVEGAAIAAGTLFLWRLLQSYMHTSPLKKLPGPPSGSIIAGNMIQMFNPRAWAYHEEIAKKFGGLSAIKGLLGRRIVYVFDPKALYHILVKDQHIYEETEDILMTYQLTFGKGILAVEGEQHRKQRKMIAPLFSTGHMRELVPTFYNVAYQLRDSISKQVAGGQTEINIHAWMTRTALEAIGQGGLGRSFGSLDESGTEHPYCNSMKNFIRVLESSSLARNLILPYVVNIGTSGFQRWVIDMLPWKSLHTLKDMVDIMDKTSREIYKGKKAAVEKGEEDLVKGETGKAKDIISVLLKANMAASKDDALTEEEVLGQLSTITFAATDTTSNALSRILHVLSENPSAQSRLREEIREARRQHGDLDYDKLLALPFLDAVCKETLRVYPPIAIVPRESRQDAILPLDNPVTLTDGTTTNEVVIPRDTYFFLSILNCNRNPAIWGTDAHLWKPERWLSLLPKSVGDAKIPGVYSHLMTFNGGGRSCVGFQFAQLEIKVVLTLLLESFQFSPSGKDILWRYNGISAPTVLEDGGKIPGDSLPQLPLLVSLAA